MSQLCFLCLSTSSFENKNKNRDDLHQGKYVRSRSCVNILIAYILQTPSSRNGDGKIRSQLQNNILHSYKKGKFSICTECLSTAEHLLSLHLELEKIQMQILDVLRSLQNCLKKSQSSMVPVEEDMTNAFGLSHFQDVLQREFISQELSDKTEVRLERLRIAGFRNSPAQSLCNDFPRIDTERGVDVPSRNAIKDEPMSSSDLTGNNDDVVSDGDNYEYFVPEIEISLANEADNPGSVQSLTLTSQKMKRKRKTSNKKDQKPEKKMSSSLWECDICLEDVPSKEMEAHLKTHPEFEKFYKCDICSKKSPNRSRLYGSYKGLVWHYFRAYHHENMPCKLCPSQDQSILFTRGQLCKHLYEIHHPNHRKLQCKNISCSQEFCDPQSLRSHQWLEHSSSVTCNICQQTFKVKKYLDRHVKRVHPEKEEFFWCASCPKYFRNKIQLRTHELNHHERELKECPHCLKMFPQHVFKNHLLIHGEKKLKCKFCPKSFTTIAGLRPHEETHAEEKKYMCSQCPYMAKTKIGLQKHMRFHGEKKFKCEYCPKTFSIQSYRDNHQRIHTGEKPYKCDVCGKAFINKSSRLRHRRKKHGIPPVNETTSTVDCAKEERME